MPDTNDQRLILTIYVIRITVYDFCHCEEQSDEAISSTYTRIFYLKTFNCKLITIYHAE
uniref:Uncharacterized protein n=1 Tax=uncultured Atribacterota bacterium TaxID=263865 RepID=G3BMJ7_9BACT|nr:hypothetical protein [uncultured Atribacterota bacterium]